MNGVIVNYRLSRNTQTPDYLVIKAEGVSTRDAAAKLVGKTAVWKSPAGKEIKGKITSAHGNTGAVRAHFERGLPGQAIANSVEIK